MSIDKMNQGEDEITQSNSSKAKDVKDKIY